MQKEKWKHKSVTGLKVSSHERLLVLKDSGLSLPVKSMYLYICEVSSWGDGIFTKSRPTIEKELAIARSTCQSYLKQLSDKGYILRVSTYIKYAFDNNNRLSFIYPLKYHNELFFKEDINKIKEHALLECDKIEKSYKVALSEIRNIILDN